MATLKNTTINDTGFLRFPSGTTDQRPGSPAAGMTRFNTTLSRLEYYNSSSWIAVGSLGSSPELAATSGKAIYAENPSAPSGVYWLKTASGTTYQAYIKMDYGGGWVNLGTSLGPYTGNVLTASWGTGGGNTLTGSATTGFIKGITPLAASFVVNNQGDLLGCGGGAGASLVNINSTLKSDLGATQVRWKFSMRNLVNVTCGYPNGAVSNLQIISGTGSNFAVCNNPPNRYSDVNPASFTAEGYGDFTGTTINNVSTACGGSLEMSLDEIYVR